ncbi:MAG: ribosome biogenesis GTPase Der, partial [Rickettsiales bacterium]|nr:ribosome biogenesis GTPase Der [Rickettsiales bacterium]
MFEIAILGRPNVGKSTLFNKLVKRQAAIVHDTAGTTRDVKSYTTTDYHGIEFVLLDTAGMEKGQKGSVAERMTFNTIKRTLEAHIILFMIDARASVTPEDMYFADEVRKLGKRVILVANKSENKGNFNNNAGDFYRLGFGEAVPLSAEHGQGMLALLDRIRKEIMDLKREKSGGTEEGGIPEEALQEIIKIEESMYGEPEEPDPFVRIAIIGRPNVGKSTLVNTLVKQDRVLTGEEAGLTRDAIDIDFKYKGRDVRLIDTAGLRRKSKIDEELERLSVARSVEAIRNSDVSVILVDATAGIDKQDLAIAGLAAREGKGLVIAMNKSDLVRDKKLAEEEALDRLLTSFSQVRRMPLLFVSAKSGRGVDALMASVFEIYGLRNQRVTTGQLNRWLERAVAKNPPPLSRLKRPMSIKYITQSGVWPPTFMLVVGGASVPPANFRRYLVTSLGVEFG